MASREAKLKQKIMTQSFVRLLEELEGWYTGLETGMSTIVMPDNVVVGHFWVENIPKGFNEINVLMMDMEGWLKVPQGFYIMFYVVGDFAQEDDAKVQKPKSSQESDEPEIKVYAKWVGQEMIPIYSTKNRRRMPIQWFTARQIVSNVMQKGYPVSRIEIILQWVPPKK